MQMSCNGCRVLRKGCSDDCPIRPCLRWIKTSLSQANATVFLAKFYGRAGLVNLLTAGPDHLRPAIFKSLLYEACGRIINPIHGSTGLLWSGSWQLCQEAVDAVLGGTEIKRISGDSALAGLGPPLQACDIRHVSKPEKGSPNRLRKVRSSKTRFKRQAAKLARADSASHGSGVCHGPARCSESDTASVENVEPSVDQAAAEHDSVVPELELTLGFDRTAKNISVNRMEVDSSSDEDTCRLRIGFDSWH